MKQGILKLTLHARQGHAEESESDHRRDSNAHSLVKKKHQGLSNF
jgi:hypothetical protein